MQPSNIPANFTSAIDSNYYSNPYLIQHVCRLLSDSFDIPGICLAVHYLVEQVGKLQVAKLKVKQLIEQRSKREQNNYCLSWLFHHLIQYLKNTNKLRILCKLNYILDY